MFYFKSIAMKPKKQTLILSLIKDDLINSKLVHALNGLGLNADEYLLNLSSNVFKLMGFEDTPQNEATYRYYLDLSQRAKYIDIVKSRERFDELALEIYTELLLRKPLR